MAISLLPPVNEGTTSYVTAVFKNKDGTAVAPDSAQYRVDCKTTGNQILAWTAIPTPTSTTEIEIDSTLNVIQDELNLSEEHVVTVEGTYGVGADKVTGKFNFELFNMYGL